MGSNLFNKKTLMVFAVAVSLALAVACGGADAPGPQAAAKNALTGGDGPRAVVSASDMLPDSGDDWYVAPRIGPAEFGDSEWKGTRPTRFNESPLIAALVKNGIPCGTNTGFEKPCPPIEERLPVPEDIRVVAPPQEIGIYGGHKQIYATHVGLSHDHSSETCLSGSYIPGQKIALTCKSVEISEDGRVYTVTLREGIKWSDCVPLTMDDVRMAWEDINFNKEYTTHIEPKYKDPVTGNRVKFGIQDDWTFWFSYDTPNFTIFEGKGTGSEWCAPGQFCWYVPLHWRSPLHPKYADGKELSEQLKAHSLDDWTKLWYKLQSDDEYCNVKLGAFYHRCDDSFLGRGQETPSRSGYQIIYRNPYYFSVDVYGNQLPYLDSVATQRVESREVAAFRAMAGEVDGPMGRDLRIRELPLLHYNMEKGDFSIFHQPSLSGMDSGLTISQDFKEDPEIGRLLRTKDFRIALSLAIDRQSINEAIFSGFGIPQNWVPHPSTAFYPGDEYVTVNAIYDLDRAKELMAKMGYSDSDGDGYLNRLDGKGNLEMFLEGGASAGLANIMSGSEHMDVAQILQKHWSLLGIKLNFRLGPMAYKRYEEGKQYMLIAGNNYNHEVWGPSWAGLTPQYKGRSMGPEVARYFHTSGKEGMKPSGPDPAWTDVYGTMSPKKSSTFGDSYPSDISRCEFKGETIGCMMALQKMIVEGRQYPKFHPERLRLGKEIFAVTVREMYFINTVGFSGCCGNGLSIARNNVRNVPRWSTGGSGHGSFSEMQYFEDGIDNFNHPGNRSKRYMSWSFAIHSFDDARLTPFGLQKLQEGSQKEAAALP